MKGMLQHIQYNILHPEETMTFYKDLWKYMELEIIYDAPDDLGATDGNLGFWMTPTLDEHKAHVYNRDATGLNHMGIKVGSHEDVDKFCEEFMKPHGLEPQWETPRARPEFGPTYYQVMFVDPEGLALEVFCG